MLQPSMNERCLTWQVECWMTGYLGIFALKARELSFLQRLDFAKVSPTCILSLLVMSTPWILLIRTTIEG
jgi:hypothetical protein